MFDLKRRIVNIFAKEEYAELESRSSRLANYDEFFPRFLDPQIVTHQLDKNITSDGEIKEVCVLFTDMRGFTKLSQRISLKAANSLLNNFYDIVIHHTQANGGVIDKFMGDGTMSIFGIYDTDGDAYVARCVAAARNILRDFTQMTNQKHEPSLFLGVGISKGQAIVGTFGNGDYLSFTAIGHTVNLAARVQGKAEDNNILVTQEVAKYLGVGEIRYKGRFELKNVNKKVPLYEVV